MSRIKITDSRQEWDDLVKGAKEIKKRKPSVKIGLFGKQGSELVIQGAANEFGATINHPGGTSFGYRTETQARQGKVRFLAKGEGFMEIGVTGPHVIKIPERSFLRSAVAENKDKITNAVGNQYIRFVGANVSLSKALNIIGLLVTNLVKAKIRKGPFKPNAPSTIKAKKSSRPLIDTGRMRQSITHELDI